MDFVFAQAFALVSLVILIACIFACRYYTNRLIKKQEKQIVRQQTEIFRLHAKVDRYVKRRPSPQVIEIHDDRIDPENVPDFNKEW